MTQVARLVVLIVALLAGGLSARAELPPNIPLGFNFDEPEWYALPSKTRDAIVLDLPNDELVRGLPEARAKELRKMSFVAEVWIFHAERYFDSARMCHRNLTQEFADLAAVIPQFWDRTNDFLKARFPEVDPTMIDRVMRRSRAMSIVIGRQPWQPYDSEACVNNRDRWQEDLRERLELIRTLLTGPLDKLNVPDEQMGPL
jgi:hypothetical protein